MNLGYSTTIYQVGFFVLTTASMKLAVFCIVASCSVVDVDRRLSCFRHLHGFTTPKTAIFVLCMNFKDYVALNDMTETMYVLLTGQDDGTNGHTVSSSCNI